MKTLAMLPGLDCTTIKPGTSRRMDGRSFACLRAMSAAVITVTSLPISAGGTGNSVGVTTIGAIVPKPAAACSADACWAKAWVNGTAPDKTTANDNAATRRERNGRKLDMVDSRWWHVTA